MGSRFLTVPPVQWDSVLGKKEIKSSSIDKYADRPFNDFEHLDSWYAFTWTEQLTEAYNTQGTVKNLGNRGNGMKRIPEKEKNERLTIFHGVEATL